MNDLDLHTFVHNNETYYVIMISNLITDIHKLDLGLQIIRKLIINFKDTFSQTFKQMNEIEQNIISKNIYFI